MRKNRLSRCVASLSCKRKAARPKTHENLPSGLQTWKPSCWTLSQPNVNLIPSGKKGIAYVVNCTKPWLSRVLNRSDVLEHNKCQPNPCKNGGSCTEINGGFECSCGAEYRGPTCEGNYHMHYSHHNGATVVYLNVSYLLTMTPSTIFTLIGIRRSHYMQ